MSDIVVSSTQERIQKINRLVLSIQANFVESVERAIELGEELLAEKKNLDHGQFQNWVETNFRFGYQTARRWMSVAENKKEVLKRLKGGTLTNMTEAYSVKTATLALDGPTATKAAKPQRQVLLEDRSDIQSEWATQPSGRLKHHKILSRGGQVFLLPENAKTPTLIYKGSLYLDAVPGVEWAHIDVLTELDRGLQLLFEDYYSTLERAADGDAQPPQRVETASSPPPTAPLAQAVIEGPEAPAKPQYRSPLDEEDE